MFNYMTLGRLTLNVLDPSRTVFHDPAHFGRAVEDVHRVHITVVVFCEYFSHSSPDEFND